MEELNTSMTAINEGGGAENQVGAGDTVTAEELLAEMEQDVPEHTAVKGGVGDQQKGEEQKPDDQSEIDKAFSRERRRIEQREQRRYAEQMQRHAPAIDIGTRLIQDIMQVHGVPMEAAVAIAEENLVRAIAARENVSPNVARAMLARPQAAAPQQQGTDMQQMAGRIREDVMHMQMPEGFDFEMAIEDETFAQMLLEMPTARAVELYHLQRRVEQAPQEIAERLRARQMLPQQGKAQQAVTPKLDFDTMSDDDFLKFKDSKNRAEMGGKRVSI